MVLCLFPSTGRNREAFELLTAENNQIACLSEFLATAFKKKQKKVSLNWPQVGGDICFALDSKFLMLRERERERASFCEPRDRFGDIGWCPQLFALFPTTHLPPDYLTHLSM